MGRVFTKYISYICIQDLVINNLQWLICHKTKPNQSFQLIGLMSRVFANGPGDLGSIPGHVIPKTLKMVLDTTLLKTQQYKLRIKGKVEQSREMSSALPYIPWCSSYWKGGLLVVLNYVHQLYLLISLKVNVLIQLVFKLAYYEVAVQYTSHDTTVTLPCMLDLSKCTVRMNLLFTCHVIYCYHCLILLLCTSSTCRNYTFYESIIFYKQSSWRGISKLSNLANHCWGWPKSFLFNCYNIKV